MGFLSFWHGKWATLAFGLALLAGGFATVALAGTVPAMVAGLVAFGAGHGVLYYASLYYAMAVGGAEVDAGGHFEALIGVGYVVGPVAGMVAGAVAGGSHAGLVGGTWAAATIGLLPALLPYLAWRKSAAAAPRHP
jgi:hypothetical protein